MSPVRGARALVVLALLAAACAQAPATTVETGWPFIFHRTGGIAGIDHRLTIEGDGSAVWQDGEERVEFQVASDTRFALQTLLEATDFRQLAEATPAPPVGADLFSYSVTYGGQTINFHDEAVPAGIESLLNLIHEIIAGQVET